LDNSTKLENSLKDYTNETQLVEDIIQWIRKINISIIPAPLNLAYFYPHNYTLAQSTILIQKGFNPKMELYRMDSKTRSQAISKWNNQLGLAFSNLEESFWFCINQSNCDSNCPIRCSDKIGKWIYGNGFRIQKSIQIGAGGFAKVYSGRIHGVDIAAKYIDVTEKYKKLFGTGSSYISNKVIPNLLGDVAFEATIQSGFGNRNILKVRDFWIQCSKLDKIELVIGTEKCYKNLQQWVDSEIFSFDQIKRFLLEVGNGLEYLETQKLSHRDIKPSNILITNFQNPVAVISDFGLVKSEGVTPLYCAPERFKKDGTVLGKTDIYSFGVSILNCFFVKDIAITILTGTVKSIPTQIVNQLRQNPILKLVKTMIRYN